MNRNLFRTLTWLLWLALPLTALRFWLVWDQLPLRMATHFNANWQPNGWMSREVALEFALGITVFLLAIFTVILLVVQRQKAADAVVWALLTFSYVVVGFVLAVNSRVVGYNLAEPSFDLNPWMALFPLAIFAFMAVYLFASRREALPPSDVIAEEVHGSPLFGFLFALMLGGTLLLLRTAPTAPVRMFIGLISLLLLVSGLAAWSGFHYFFTRRGVEIRALGFRLRSIPADQIKQYGIQSWNLLRGYGIRGVGNRRAYVWGNRGVQLTTSQGEVFLGHDDPDRIVRDLDMIKSDPRGHEDPRS
ncbi:MAG: DUF1648 domain-containing protein [Terriglobales bacterium]